MTDIDSIIHQADMALQSGQLDAAQSHYRAAVAIDPQRPDIWFNLAWIDRVNRRFEEALCGYERAIQTGLSMPAEAHVNRAAILSEHLNRPEDAKHDLECALALAPDFIPAHLNLGSLHEDYGNPIEAIHAYDAVLKTDPGNGRALARASAIQLATPSSEAVIGSLEAGLANSRNRPIDRAEILFALGHAEDAREHYQQAFAYFEAGNRLARQVAGPMGLFNHAAHSAMIDQIIDAFPKRIDAASSDDDEQAPVFICGMFRSGSTLCEQLVSTHGDISAGGELDLIPAMVHHRLSPFPERMGALSSTALSALRQDYHGGTRLRGLPTLHTDKRPDNFLYLGLIKTLFPRAKVINTVRDPIDTLLSIYFTYLDDSVSYSFDPKDIIHYISEYQRLMAHWRGIYGEDIIDLHYEAVVNDPNNTIATTLKACGIATKTFAPTTGPVRTPSAWQVRQPIHNRSVGRANHYAAALKRHGIDPQHYR